MQCSAAEGSNRDLSHDEIPYKKVANACEAARALPDVRRADDQARRDRVSGLRRRRGRAHVRLAVLCLHIYYIICDSPLQEFPCITFVLYKGFAITWDFPLRGISLYIREVTQSCRSAHGFKSLRGLSLRTSLCNTIARRIAVCYCIEPCTMVSTTCCALGAMPWSFCEKCQPG